MDTHSQVWLDQRSEAGEVAVRIAKAAMGLVPFVGGGLSEAVDYFWHRWQEPKVEAYIEEVTRAATADFWREATLDTDQSELLARGLRAAMDADSEMKARALGRTVASGVGGDRPVDEARLVVASLARIEGPHIRVLDALAQPRPGGPGYPEGALVHGQVSEELVLARVPGVGRALATVLSVLQSEGLAVQHGPSPYAGASPEWSLTHHGELLLDHVRDRAAEVAEPGDPIEE